VEADHVNHITKGFDLSTAAGVTKFGAYLGTQGTVQAITQTAIQGGSLKDNLKASLTDELQHLLQATVFNAVGDFAGDHHWQDGSPEKIALHAVVGGLLSEATGGDFKTGAAVAGANEALTERISHLIKADPQVELVVSQMIGVAAATLTEGDINQAAQLAKNATSYNRQLHRAEADLLQELREKDPERAEQWDAAACALVSCSKGVPPSDQNYAFLAALEAEGAKYPELQNALLDTQLFNYSFADKTSDLALRNARGAYYTAAAGNIVLGTGGAILSGAAGGAACVPSVGLGCAAAVGGVGLGMLEASEGANKIAKGYTSTQGQTVIDSFSPETHPGNWNPALEGIKFAGAVTVEAILAKVGGKLVGKVIDKVDGKTIHALGNKSTTHDLPDNKPELTIRDHYNHHKNMTEDLKQQLESQGYRVSGKEISFGSFCDSGRCRPDIVYQTPDGKWGIIEVKTGNADLSIRQSEIFPQINSGDAIPRGDVAKRFGFTPDVPLKDQGHPNGIPIEVVNFPGVGQ